MGVRPIDLVACNFYPFERAAGGGASEEVLLENIDIGGPSLVRAAAKNYRHVIVVVDPEDYPRILQELEENGDVSMPTRKRLALRAFSLTAAYDSVIHRTLSEVLLKEEIPAQICLCLRRARELRYGENPHQRSWLYIPYEGNPWSSRIEFLQGKSPSFNNYLDAFACLSLLDEFREPTCVVVKHGNPCGVACRRRVEDAFRAAWNADPVSAFGGVVAINREVSEELALEMKDKFIDLLLAPGFSEAARKVLRRKVRRSVAQVGPSPEQRVELRWLGGDFLVQEADSGAPVPTLEVKAGKPPDGKIREDLIFAYTVVKHVKSNAIVVARDKVTCGICGGQTSRVGAARIALERAGERARGAVLASDGFLPFPDTVQLAARAGVAAIVEPGGSVRDSEVTAECAKAGITLVFTHVRHFRH